MLGGNGNLRGKRGRGRKIERERVVDIMPAMVVFKEYISKQALRS